MGDAIRRPSYGSVIPPGLLPPGTAVTLVGDVNGPSNANHVDTLTGPGTGIVNLANGTKLSSPIAGIGDLITAAGTTLTYGSTTPNNQIFGSLTRGFVNANAAGLARVLVATSESATIGTNARDNFTFFCTTAGDAYLMVVNSTADAAAGTGPKVYALAGALKCVGTGGTITTLAAADLDGFADCGGHCPSCGSDFAVEWKNEKMGALTICMMCLAKELGDRPWIRRKVVT